jgi:YhcH/YjgK/YiaL family protein
MILDTLPNWQSYEWPGDAFHKAFSFLMELDEAAADGRYEIDGEDVFCMVQSYQTEPGGNKRFEAHRVYADIQLILKGNEAMLWAPIEGMNEAAPYEHDVVFYPLVDGAQSISMIPGHFAVLFPQDAHVPGLAQGEPQQVRKAVAKVRVA